MKKDILINRKNSLTVAPVNMKLILASASPQRRKLLKRLKIPFRIVPSDVSETNPAKVSHKKSRRLVIDLAVKKAKAVAKNFRKESCVILGADTLVVCNGRIFGKPSNEAHARNMLRQLSGSWQTVVTGLCVIFNPEGRMKTAFAETRLKFKKIDEKTIAKLARKNLDKSGSYAIQKINDRFVETMLGDLDNVIGLPLRQVKQLLFRSL